MLGLSGGVWEVDVERERTPGRGVEGGLWFGRGRVGVRVRREGGWESVKVEEEEQEEGEHIEGVEAEMGVVSTPAAKNVVRLREMEGAKEWSYTSPAFAKRVRLSGEDLVYSAYDPFALKASDSEGDDHGVRRSFGEGMKWRWYTGKTPSPTKEVFDQVEASPTRQTSRVDQVGGTEERSMLPPPLPRLEVPAGAAQQELSPDNGPSTPKILPIKFPTLPLPSPFPTGVVDLPFGDDTARAAVIDARRHEDIRDDDGPSEIPVIAEVMDDERRKQVDVVDLLSESEAEDEDEEMLDIQPGSEINANDHVPMDEYAMDEHYIPRTLTLVEQRQPDILEPGKDLDVHEDPKIPGLVTPQKPSGIAFDGTSSAPASTHVTPQSEKDRVMKRTFQSLFGFTGSPEPQQVAFPGLIEREESPSPDGNLSGMVRKGQEAVEEGIGESVTDASRFVDQASENVQETPIGLGDDVGVGDIATAASPTPADRKQIEVIELDSDSEEDAKESQQNEMREEIQQPHRVSSLSQTLYPEIQDNYEDPNADDFVKTAREGEFQVSDNLAHLPDANLEPAPYDTTEASGVEDGAVAADEGLLQLEESLEHRVPATSLSPVFRSHAPDADSAFKPLEFDVEPVTEEPVLTTRVASVGQTEQPGSTAGTTAAVIELDSSSPAEALPSSPLYPSLPLDLTQISVESEHAEEPQQQSISYPSLPMSPSNSQTLNEMSQPAADALRYETSATMFPPTPQLTQAGSSMKVHEDAEQRIMEDALEEELAQPKDTNGEGREATPTEQSQGAELEQQRSSQPARTPARKSIGTRLSNVPDVISAWFSPKRSPAQKDVPSEKLHQDTASAPQKRVHTNGISTAHAYFTPLSRLEEHLNPSSQLSFGTQTIDVFAVVTESTADPAHAKSGPRDYYTILRITDSSISRASDVRVEVFRPWKATLPVAKVGDVVLLRAFAVKSRKRQAHLLSTDASAWCVWRYREVSVDEGNSKKPIWARKADQGNGSVREEVKGPPVEFGEKEKEHARELRLWWEGMATIKAGGEGYDDGDGDEGEDANEAQDVGLNGHGVQAVAAKL